jgi:hypothetical protein
MSLIYISHRMRVTGFGYGLDMNKLRLINKDRKIIGIEEQLGYENIQFTATVNRRLIWEYRCRESEGCIAKMICTRNQTKVEH